MGFVSTIDTRPHTLGNLLMVTGTFQNESVGDTGGIIDLSGLLADIVVCGGNAFSSTPGNGSGTEGVFALHNGSTLVIQSAGRQAGTWFAMGHRN